MIEIAPSILAADFARLGEQVKEAHDAGADRIHVDAMDGRYVPNLTFGPLAVEAIRSYTDRTIEAHLMIVEPENYLGDFAKAGSDLIIVHQETCPHLHSTIQRIRDLGVRAGVVINPSTPVSTLTEILADVDLILIMTVNPGFGGQKFIESTVPKIRQLRSLLDERGLTCDIEVDGGIDPTTAPLTVTAGANVLVAGSSVYRAKEGVAAAISSIRAAAE